MSYSTARSELLRRRLDQLTRALPGLEQGDVRALHRARVASRRLRELVPVLPLDHASSRKLSRRLRRLTSHLGTVRELDVMMLGIDEMHEARRVQSAALARVGVAVSKDRDRARRRLFERAPIQDVWRLARKFERIVAELKQLDESSSRSATRNWKWAVDARLERRATRLVTAVQDAGTVYIPERLHVVRIALKKLRYAFELANDVSAVRADADLRAFKRGQDLLGRMHDLQVLIERVRQVQASLTPPDLAMWRALDGLVIFLDNMCRQLHGRYIGRRTELQAIVGRLGKQRPAPATLMRRIVG